MRVIKDQEGFRNAINMKTKERRRKNEDEDQEDEAPKIPVKKSDCVRPSFPFRRLRIPFVARPANLNFWSPSTIESDIY